LIFIKLFLYIVKYWLRFQIGDHTTNTSYTIFNDEARRLLKISVSELLELQGGVDDVLRVIHELYGKVFIFYFKLSEVNLTEGRHGYLVKRTFVPDVKLEKKSVNDKKKEASGVFFVYSYCLFVYKYSNLSFKL
jgi:hypothetical protein